MIWKLLKQYVRDFEDANNVKFSDQAWQRVKKLEADIEHWIYEVYEKPNMPAPIDWSEGGVEYNSDNDTADTSR